MNKSEELEDRIRVKMFKNLDKNELERSYEYCKTYVEGEMAIEETILKKHSEKYVAAYRDGFHDGADCKQNFKLHMLGYEVGELLKIIEEHEMQNKLMTKAEAVKAHAKTQENSMVEYWNETEAKSKLFVEGLEALGLIEFKPPLVKLFEETTPSKGIIRLMKNENNSYTLWYHGQKVWGNE